MNVYLYIKIHRDELRESNMKIHNRGTSIKGNHHLPRSDNIAEILHQRERARFTTVKNSE